MIINANQLRIDQLIRDASPDVFMDQSDDNFKPVSGGFRAGRNSGKAIFEKKGIWLFKDFSDGDAAKNVLKYTADNYNLNLRNKNDLIEAMKIICEFGGLNPSAYIDQPEDQQRFKPAIRTFKKKTTQPTRYIPNSAKEPTQKTKYTITDLSPGAIEYLKQKTGATIEILEKYNLKQCTFAYGQQINDIAIVWQSGGNLKYKRPHAPKDQKERYLQSSGNYIFGWDQLPPGKVEILILAAGETDTIALNEMFKDEDVFAICLNSETTTITPELLTVLKEKAHDIICLFDNDRTGLEAMQRNFEDHQIPYIDIGRIANDREIFDDRHFESGYNTSINDICDLVREYGKIRASEIILSIPTHEWNPIKFGEYILPKTLSEVISLSDRAIVKAPTGSGKTTAAMELDNMIIVVPLISIAEQIQIDYKRRKRLHIPIVGGGHKVNLNTIQNENRIICTSDSLYKLEHLLPERLLIIDENHVLADAADYRLNASNNVLRMAEKAKKVLMISATPEVFSGYHLFELQKTGKKQVKEIQRIEYTGKLINFQLPTESGLHIIRANDIKVLEVLQASSPPGQSTIFSAKENRKYLEGNLHYDQILNGKEIDHKGKPFYIFTTCVIDTGISFVQQVKSIHNLTPGHDRETVQFFARSRMTGSTNEKIKLFEYFPKNHKREPGNYNLIRYFHNYREKAYRIAEGLNLITGNDVEITLRGDDAELTFRHGEKYYISEAYICHLVNNERNKGMTAEKRAEALKRWDDSIVIIPTTEKEFSKDKNEKLHELKTQLKENKELAAELYLQHNEDIQIIVSKTSKDHSFRRRIRERSQKCDWTESTYSFYDAHQDFFNKGIFDVLIKRHFELLSLGVGDDEAIQVVVFHNFKRTFRGIRNAYAIAYNQLREDHQQKVNKLYKEVRNAKKNGKKSFPVSSIKKWVKESGFELKGSKEASVHIERLRWLFEMKRVGKGLYEIGKKHSKTSLKSTAKMNLNLPYSKNGQSFEKEEVMKV